MRVVRALSIIAALVTFDSAFACQLHSANRDGLTEADVIAVLREPLLLNGEDYSQADRLQAEVVVASDEPVLLNRDLNVIEPLKLAEETFARAWDHLDVLPGVVATLDLPHARVIVDDEGVPLFDVDYTGSVETPVHGSELALDGFEDR
jgi:hypothetical protein